MPFPCPKCSRVFDSKPKLEIHLNRLISCVSDTIKSDPLSCILCGHSFTTTSNLRKHNSVCVVRKNPELAIKRLENSKIVNTDNSTNSTNTDNSTNTTNNNIKNIDKSTNNINVNVNVNVVNSNIIIPFKQKDIKMMVKWFLRAPGSNDVMEKFWSLYRENKLKHATKLILNALHNNPIYHSTQNLLYCRKGIHKGKFLTYVDANWLISNLDTIINIIEIEMKMLIKEFKDMENLDSDDEKNMSEFKKNSRNMSKYADFITEIIKKFMKSNMEEYPPIVNEGVSAVIKRALDNKINLLTNKKMCESLSISDSDSSNCDESSNESESSNS